MYKNEKIDVIIVGRMGSTRLPGKTLSEMGDSNMLGVLVERVKKSKYVDRVLISTSNNKKDEILFNWATENNLLSFRGSQNNVLKRLQQTADYFQSKNIVFLLADNPLIHSDLIDSCIENFFRNNYDFLTTNSLEFKNFNNSLNLFPVGVRVQVFKTNKLNVAFRNAKSEYNKEHSTSYFIENMDEFKVKFIDAEGKFLGSRLSNFNFAVNTSEQLDCIRKIYTNLVDKNENFNLKQIVDYVKNNDDQFEYLKI